MRLDASFSALALMAILSTSPLRATHPDGGQPRSTTEDVTFVAQSDGTHQKYVLVLPESFHPDHAYDVLVALHGAGSDRWQFVRDPRAEARAVRDVAAARRMILVAPDYRATESWINALAEADVVQILQELKLQYRVARVFLCGGSMGGAACLTFAARHPTMVDGVASINGTANFFEQTPHCDSIERAFAGTVQEIPQVYKLRSAEYWPEQLSMPVAMVVGGRDTSLPPGSARRLAGVLQTLGRRVLLIDRPESGHDASYADTRSILEFAVQRPPIPDGLVVLTFDDRAKSWATNVAPILRRYGFGATFFVTDSKDFSYQGNDRFWASCQDNRGLHDDGFELGSTFEEFAQTVALARDGKIVVLVFHGVPDYYPHCSTQLEQNQ